MGCHPALPLIVNMQPMGVATPPGCFCREEGVTSSWIQTPALLFTTTSRSRFCAGLIESSLGCSTEKAMAHPLQYSCLENPMDGGAW